MGGRLTAGLSEGLVRTASWYLRKHWQKSRSSQKPKDSDVSDSDLPSDSVDAKVISPAAVAPLATINSGWPFLRCRLKLSSCANVDMLSPTGYSSLGDSYPSKIAVG